MTTKEERRKQINASLRLLRQAHRDAGEVSRERWAHKDDWALIDRFIERMRKRRGTFINRPKFSKDGIKNETEK